jgi:hypothetical protein
MKHLLTSIISRCKNREKVSQTLKIRESAVLKIAEKLIEELVLQEDQKMR